MNNCKIGIPEILRSVGSWRLKSIKLFDYVAGTLIASILFTKKPFNPQDLLCKRILVIRPGGIGDAIFLLPILKILKRQNRDIKIDILCEKRNSQIFLSQRGLCENVYLFYSISSFISLFNNSYDIIFDTEQWHYLTAIVSYFLNSKCTIGFSTRHLRSKLLSNPIEYRTDVYELDNFRNLFRPILNNDQKVEDINGSFQVPQKCLLWAKDQVPGDYVAFFLGGSIPARRLNEAQVISIIKEAFRLGFYVILLGGRDILKLNKNLEKKVSSPYLCSFVGKTSLEESAALIKNSRLFIGVDSGLMHLACAVNVASIITFFGPGNSTKWSPKGARYKVISKNLACSPCTNFGYTVTTCRDSYECIRTIDCSNIIIK